MKNSLDSYFSPEALINPEGRKIWLYQIIKLSRRRGNLNQLLCLTSTGKSHCYGDPEWPLLRYLCVDALSGFGKVSRLFNKYQITKFCSGLSCRSSSHLCSAVPSRNLNFQKKQMQMTEF